MKISIKRSLIIIFSICLIIAASLIIVFSVKNEETVLADNATFEKIDLKSEYQYNTVFEVPDVVLKTSQGQLLENPSATVCFPDGQATEDEIFVLDQCGVYKVIYEQDGFVASREFNVLNSVISFESSDSSATYVDKLNSSVTGSSGYSVKLAAGDTLTYNVPINIYETGNELFNLIKFYPKVYNLDTKQLNARYLVVSLVDCYDESNYIDFVLVGVTGDKVYMAAGGSNQTVTGFNTSNWNNDGIVYEDKTYDVRFINMSDINSAGRAIDSQTNISDGTKTASADISYNVNSQQVFLSEYDYVKDTNTVRESKRKIVTDLNDANVYTNRGDNVFEGFTTGEVYMTISTVFPKSTVIEMEIESIFGRSGEDLNGDFYKDADAPRFDFEGKDFSDKIIKVKKGDAITLPEPKMVDINLKGDYSVAAYYNFGTADSTIASVKDLVFTPNQLGLCTVEYLAEDYYGNVGKAYINYVVGNDDIFSYTYNKLSTLKTGYENVLPDIAPTSANGAVIQTISITAPNGEVVTLPEGKNTFVPELFGKYKISYNLHDGYLLHTFSYDVSTIESSGEVPFFKDEFNIGKTLIKNAYYSFDYSGYLITTDGLKPEKTTVKYSFDGAAFESIPDGEVNNFRVVGNDTLQIKFVCKERESEVYTYEILDIGYSSEASTLKAPHETLSKVFMNNNYTFAGTRSSYDFIFDGSSSSETIRYANPIFWSEFRFKFELAKKTDVGALANFNSLEIKLIDYSDENNTISCVYKKNGEGVIYSVGNKTYSSAINTFAGLSDTIVYNSNKNTISNDKYGDGQMPNFTSEYCYLEITLSGISGESGLSVIEVNNQQFKTNTSSLKLATTIFKSDTIQGSFAQNSKYTIEPCRINNVLLPLNVNNAKISVTAPSGEYVVDTNGVTLNQVENKKYEIQLSEVGNYSINYSIVNAEGNTETSMFVVISNDSEAPTITFADSFNENTLVTTYVGNRHYVKAFDALDNEGNVTATIFIMDAAGNYFTICAVNKDTGNYDLVDNGYVFEEAGDYKVVVFAQDTIGNSTTAYYNVKVLELEEE